MMVAHQQPNLTKIKQLAEVSPFNQLLDSMTDVESNLKESKAENLLTPAINNFVSCGSNNFVLPGLANWIS